MEMTAEQGWTLAVIGTLGILGMFAGPLLKRGWIAMCGLCCAMVFAGGLAFFFAASPRVQIISWESGHIQIHWERIIPK